VRGIVAEARGHLNPGGALVCEIGQGRARFEAEFPELNVVWLDTAESEGEVFFASAEALPGGGRRRGK
jgi:ribosomal protein L3 glutamine methyltransferase